MSDDRSRSLLERPATWRSVVLLTVGVPIVSGLVLSSLANRLAFVLWGLLVAGLAAVALCRFWRRGVHSVLAAICAQILLGGASLGLLLYHYDTALGLGSAATGPTIAALGEALPTISWSLAVVGLIGCAWLALARRSQAQR